MSKSLEVVTYQILESNVKEMLEFLIEAAKQELKDQGHYLTGKLDRSFESKIETVVNDTVTGRILQEDYALTLDSGIAPEDVNPNDPIYIKGLQDYFKKRGYSITKSKGLANATAIKASRIGHPTKPYYKGRVYSKNGRRTGWIAAAYSQKNIDAAESLLRLDKWIDAIVSSTIQNAA